MTLLLRLTRAGLLILLFPAFVGCTSALPNGREAGSGKVTASVWALRSFAGRDVPRFRREAVTLQLLPDHGITGTASCNDVGGSELSWAASTNTTGSFARDPSQPTITTLVGCNDVAAMQIASRFWAMMTKAREWSVDRGDLFIRFDDGSIAVLRTIGSPADTLTGCHSTEPNNLDCLYGANSPKTER